jgi:hypothetical protein
MTSNPIPGPAGGAGGPVAPPGPPNTLDARTPLLMLPVNIETRFMDISAGQSELWVRIYPDQIAINTHEPELTEQEVTDGKEYWNAVWRAGKPPTSLEVLKAAWRGLAQKHEPPRAAWIALQMTPQNIAAQPVAATAAAVAPVPPPQFPTPTLRKSTWEQPATAAALPDAWTVVTVVGVQTKTFKGGPITPNLAVGFTPGAGAFPPGQPVDAAMTWLVDFDAALKAGMALKIPLDPTERARGFDRIFVYSLRTAKPPGSSAFGDLLDAHHYTDGFSLVPQGGPTNNTTDADSHYSRKDLDFEFSFATERQGPLTKNATADGNVFAKLVGINPAHLAHAGYANGSNAQSGKDMFTALWPATLGYFFTQMMADVFTPEEIDAGRTYVLANAIPRGPVPAFRIGRTPYGVLPVTAIQRYRLSAEPVETALADFVGRLRPAWIASSASAPHVDRAGDPDQQLIAVLGMDASSMTFRGRQVLGNNFIWNYMSFLGIPIASMAQWSTNHLVRGRQLLDSFGFNTWDPRLIHLGLLDRSAPVPFPTVQSGSLSETDPLKADANLDAGKTGNYIEWLRQASVDEIRAENYPGPKPNSLLYKILRQSLILDYADLASKSEIAAGRIHPSQIRESEIVGLPGQPATPTTPKQLPTLSVWEILARPSTVNANLSWADFLVTVKPPAGSPFARLNELRDSLDRLAKLPTAELDRLLTETLDACSHRLDVWASAIANAILQRTRAGQNSAVHLGSFGWLEDVRPGVQRLPVQGVELDRVRSLDSLRAQRINRQISPPLPVQPLQDNGGFIYAPSFAQAATAAILRNGFMTHKGTAEEGLLSLDISSDRVRKALYLLSGVRQGQSLNALLGFIFEQGLHDLHLDPFVQAFRDRFPIIGDKLTPSSDPTESVAASNVVDGVALRTAFDNSEFPPGANWGPNLPAPGANQTAVLGLMQLIDDYADALSDVSIAEAVFQIMRGNFGRAGGMMDAVSKGDRPPDPEVVNPPRGGLDLTHRILLLFAGNFAVTPAWSGIPSSPRAAAEPALNAWLSRMLPNPAAIRCQVKFHNAAGDHTVNVRLADLRIGPLDCLAIADAAEIPQQSEAERRILFAAHIPAAVDNVHIDYNPPGLPPGTILFPDFFFLAKTLRSMIGGSRVLDLQDLTLPEKNPGDLGGVVDAADLRTRASAALVTLQADVTALKTAAAGLPGAPDPVRTALLRASLYGVDGSVPLTSTGPETGLADQAASVIKTLQARLTQVSGVTIATAALADVLGVFKTIFGDLTVLPRMTPPNLASLQSAFGQSSALIASDPAAPARWFQQLTYVRPGVSRLDSALTLAQVLSGPAVAAPQPLLGQIPSTANDRWLALPIDPSKPFAKGRVAFACITMGNPVTEKSYSGLIVDEWPERIPSTQEQASVAFHYEEPNARAPQSLLLAVCPDSRPSWDDDVLLATLQETLDLAKIRTVDLDSVQQVGQILPALYFALNLQGASMSANFTLPKEVALAAKELRR